MVECLEKDGAHGVELWDVRLCAMLYADDLILLSENEDDLKLQIASLGNYATKWKMEINPEKSKVMIFNDPKKGKRRIYFIYSIIRKYILHKVL